MNCLHKQIKSAQSTISKCLELSSPEQNYKIGTSVIFYYIALLFSTPFCQTICTTICFTGNMLEVHDPFSIHQAPAIINQNNNIRCKYTIRC